MDQLSPVPRPTSIGVEQPVTATVTCWRDKADGELWWCRATWVTCFRCLTATGMAPEWWREFGDWKVAKADKYYPFSVSQETPQSTRHIRYGGHFPMQFTP